MPGRIVIGGNGAQGARLRPSGASGNFFGAQTIAQGVSDAADVLTKHVVSQQEIRENVELANARIFMAKQMADLQNSDDFKDIEDFKAAPGNFRNALEAKKSSVLARYSGSEKFMNKLDVLWNEQAYAASDTFMRQVNAQEAEYYLQVGEDNLKLYANNAADAPNQEMFDKQVADAHRYISTALSPFMTEGEELAAKSAIQSTMFTNFVLQQAKLGKSVDLEQAKKFMDPESLNQLRDARDQESLKNRAINATDEILQKFESFDDRMKAAGQIEDKNLRLSTEKYLRVKQADEEAAITERRIKQSNTLHDRLFDALSNNDIVGAQAVIDSIPRDLQTSLRASFEGHLAKAAKGSPIPYNPVVHAKALKDIASGRVKDPMDLAVLYGGMLDTETTKSLLSKIDGINKKDESEATVTSQDRGTLKGLLKLYNIKENSDDYGHFLRFAEDEISRIKPEQKDYEFFSKLLDRFTTEYQHDIGFGMSVDNPLYEINQKRKDDPDYVFRPADDENYRANIAAVMTVLDQNRMLDGDYELDSKDDQDKFFSDNFDWLRDPQTLQFLAQHLAYRQAEGLPINQNVINRLVEDSYANY